MLQRPLMKPPVCEKVVWQKLPLVPGNNDSLCNAVPCSNKMARQSNPFREAPTKGSGCPNGILSNSVLTEGMKETNGTKGTRRQRGRRDKREKGQRGQRDKGGEGDEGAYRRSHRTLQEPNVFRLFWRTYLQYFLRSLKAPQLFPKIFAQIFTEIYAVQKIARC